MPLCDGCIVSDSHQNETSFIVMLLANNAMVISFWLNSHYFSLHVSSFQLVGELIKYSLQQEPGYMLCTSL